MSQASRDVEGDVTVENAYGGTPDGDGGSDQHPGAVWTGLVLFALIIYSIYSGHMIFSTYNAALLVVLALGSKALN